MPFDANTIGTAQFGFIPSSGVFSDTFALDATGTDVDIIVFSLEAGSRFSFDVDAGSDTFLRLFDENGNELASNDDRAGPGEAAGLSPYIEFNTYYTGLYYVAVSPFYLDSYDPVTVANRNAPFNALPPTSGTLTVTDLGENVFPDTNTIGGITPGSLGDLTALVSDGDGRARILFNNNEITGSDIDLARVDLQKGDLLVVDVNSSGSGLDSFLRIFNAAGIEVAVDDDTGPGLEAELSYAVTTTGTYFIGISGFGNNSYNPVTGAVSGFSSTGGYGVVVYLNPTLIGTSLANLLSGSTGEDFIVALAGADVVTGDLGDDSLFGGGDSDSLLGGDGDDGLFGDTESDTLDGGNGRDLLIGGTGNDSLRGGEGDDRLQSGGDFDTLEGGGGNDKLGGGGENDRLLGGDGNDLADGGEGFDTLFGGNNDDSLNGGRGSDQLFGDAGNDTLDGDRDADTIDGGIGNDVLTGNTGRDILTGGAGSDFFNFDAIGKPNKDRDTITDFLVGIDLIDVSTIFDVSGANVTAANFSLFVSVLQSGADAIIQIDANGAAGGANFQQIATVQNVNAGLLFDPASFLL